MISISAPGTANCSSEGAEDECNEILKAQGEETEKEVSEVSLFVDGEGSRREEEQRGG